MTNEGYHKDIAFKLSAARKVKRIGLINIFKGMGTPFRRNSAICTRTYTTQYITFKVWKSLALNVRVVSIITGSKVIG